MKENKEVCYLVSEEWQGRRLDLFLAQQNQAFSRSYFKRLVEKGLIRVGASTPKPSYIIKEGDQVFVSSPEPLLTLKPESIPLDIIFEDDSLLVVNKPANIIVHPNSIEGVGSLVQAALYHTKSMAEAIYDVDSLVSRMRPGIVHRLDKDTSGVMVIAKTKQALMHLSEQFRQHTVEKIYTALVFGNLTDSVTIHTNLVRKTRRNKNTMQNSKAGEEKGKEAISHISPTSHYFYRPTEKELTLVECTIETGRTHQIRSHCKYSGFPVIGDTLYTTKSAREISSLLGATRQLLHAHSLRFIHPITGKSLHFEAPLPEDFKEILTSLEKA